MKVQPTTTPTSADLQARCQQGFTLIELVMVLVLLGVLAVVATPRIFNRNDFVARGFHDQTLSHLRYAQKTAIAQRRTVCVTFGANSVALAIADTAATNACNAALPGPSGASQAAKETYLVAKSGVTFSGTPTGFNFDGLGQPVSTNNGALLGTQAIQVVGAGRSITVESVTGYVHD